MSPGGIPRMPKRQRSEHVRKQNAKVAFGGWLHAGLSLLAGIGLLLSIPRAASAALAGSEPVSIALIGAGGLMLLAVLAGCSIGLAALLRRTRAASNEARRLNALLDVLDEGVAVCTGM